MTFASAYQFVLTTGGPVHFTAEGNKEIEEIRNEIRDLQNKNLSVDELRCQLMLYVGIMTVAWLLDVPALIRSRFGDAAAAMTRKHPLIKNDESVRAPLQMLNNALHLWDTERFGTSLDTVLVP